MTNLLNPPPNLVTPAQIAAQTTALTAEASARIAGDANEAAARTTAVDVEASERIAGDAEQASLRAAADTQQTNRLNVHESLIAVNGGAQTTRLTHAALAANIADIGSDGTTLTIYTDGAHGMADGDYVNVLGTENYDGTYGPIDVIAADELRVPTIIPATAHEIVGAVRTSALRVVSTSGFLSRQWIEVSNDEGSIHSTQITIAGGLLHLDDAIPSWWLLADDAGASVDNPVSITTRETVLARHALPYGGTYTPHTLADTIRELSRETFFPERFGAVTGEDADRAANVAAFLAADAAAYAIGGRTVAVGEYWVDDTVILRANCDMSQATLKCDDPSVTVLQIGVDTAYTTERRYILPHVDYVGHVAVLMDDNPDPNVTNLVPDPDATGWGDGSGARLVNLRQCHVYIGRALQHGIGVLVTSLGGRGTVCNHFHLTHQQSNEVGVQLWPGDDDSWVNENQFWGGRWSLDSLEGVRPAGSCHIDIAGAAHPVNNNVFHNPDLEGKPEYQLRIRGGFNNKIVHGRWEVAGGGNAYVFLGKYLTNLCTGNIIDGGYAAHLIKVHEEANAVAENWLLSHRGWRVIGRGGNNGVFQVNTLSGAGESPAFQVTGSTSLADAIVRTTTGDTHTNTTIDNVASTTGIEIGSAISGTGIPAGTTVSNIAGTTLTISQPATATAVGITITTVTTVSRTASDNYGWQTGEFYTQVKAKADNLWRWQQDHRTGLQEWALADGVAKMQLGITTFRAHAAMGSSGFAVWSNASGSDRAILSLLGSLATTATNAITAYGAAYGALYTKLKGESDVGPRIAFIHDNGVVWFGDGLGQKFLVTLVATGGTWTFTLSGATTAALAYNISAASLQTALEALSTIGASNVTVSGSNGGPFTVRFIGSIMNRRIAPTVSGASLTGGGAAADIRLLHPYISYGSDNTLAIGADTIRMLRERTITNANDPGTEGDYCFDDNFLYRCVATNTWKRAALSTW